jgi:hypothetical protein
MPDGDDLPPNVIPLPPRPKSDEVRADAQWEILARREARMLKHSPQTSPLIGGRIRWWIAAAFIVAVIVVFRDRIAAWLPGSGF